VGSETYGATTASATSSDISDVDSARLRALKQRYWVLETSSVDLFSRIARLAAHSLGTPFATVSIVEADRVWFKAAYGFDGVRQVDRELGLSGSAILDDVPYVVGDTVSDPHAARNSLVQGPLGIRFYAGAPIITADGHRIGTVDVLDVHPRDPSEVQVGCLVDLAAIAAEFLELGYSSANDLRGERTMRDTAELERDMARDDRDSARQGRDDARRDRDTAERGRESAVRGRESAERDRDAAVRRRTTAERDRQVAEQARDEIEEYAMVLQRTLLPPMLPKIPGLTLAAHYHPASRRQVGGDFYDVFALGDGRWAFFLGDVEGHGPAAAAVTSLIRYTLRSAALHHSDPARVLEELNAVLVRDTNETRFCTVLFGTVQPSVDGVGFQVTLATGGHLPALLLDPGAGTVSEIRSTTGMLVGAIAAPAFSACSVRLRPGQTLALYTDGLIESPTGDRAQFGEDGLAEFAVARTAQGAKAFVDDVEALITTLRPVDDIAVLAFSCQ
jgi:sigma-B regulation protein RsbU (phosphoserine phosphatase)